MLWIVGPAGVGKSAIMQTIAETSPNLGASLFFFVNVRDNPARVITTLAYQIATKHPRYRDHIRQKAMDDPILWEKSMSVQFEEFIVEPFVKWGVLKDLSPLLMILDGLDECSGIEAQCKLINLISGFAIRYPFAPLLWAIASRPEPHITACFGRTTILPSYQKIELAVESDESREDVERFLGNELEEIRAKYPSLSILSRWPSESDFLKLAAAANGLFAYASTAVKFIDDSAYGHPSAQLRQVLETIDAVMPSVAAPGKTDPMALLHSLYERILAPIPDDVFDITRKLLLATGILDNYQGCTFYMTGACNWLGLSPDDAYAALHHLHSVLKVPSPLEAESSYITVHHKSFRDYLTKLSPQDDTEFRMLEFQCALRILKDVPEDSTSPASPDFSDSVILAWPRQKFTPKSDKSYFYAWASSDLTQSVFLEDRLISRDPATIHAIRVMALGTEQTPKSSIKSPLSWLLDVQSIVDVLHEQRLLRRVPVKMLRLDSTRCAPRPCYSRYRLKLPSDVSPSEGKLVLECDEDTSPHRYELKGEFNGYKVWSKFSSSTCKCFSRVWGHVEYAREHTPDLTVTAFIGARQFGLVVCNSTDRDEEGGEWTHVIPYRFPEDTEWVS